MDLEVTDAVRCTACGGRAEPEQDGDLVYYACECGFEFGYRRVEQQDTCAAGLPLAMVAANARPPRHRPDGPVFVGGIGRG